MTSLRELTTDEHLVLKSLLGANFPERDALHAQLAGLVVESIDENGSLRLVPASSVPAEVAKRVPVEAEAPDKDGVTIHLLLHVVDGILHELEVYRDDSERVKRMPQADALDVMVLG